ncbi:hypothetical protein C900_02743 [Fulvivirga imtechensis AK7]|uniref:Uncharacterized protein n=1 Tax=Fulvivirga imtechensis AK7 TaxID=1237149 RepID=L8JVZ2_9BACT|nr:hypothetical protein C900_02743 [Fulvivirga imtechensis AK7]
MIIEMIEMTLMKFLFRVEKKYFRAMKKDRFNRLLFFVFAVGRWNI